MLTDLLATLMGTLAVLAPAAIDFATRHCPGRNGDWFGSHLFSHKGGE